MLDQCGACTRASCAGGPDLCLCAFSRTSRLLAIDPKSGLLLRSLDPAGGGTVFPSEVCHPLWCLSQPWAMMC